MRAAVVVTTFNRVGYLPDLIECLERQTTTDFELVIVDNGSDDGTFDELLKVQAATAMEMRALRLCTNRGPGSGRNAGVALTTAPVVALTDDDALPTPDWLARLVACFDDPDVVVAQGRVEPDPATRDQTGPFDHTISVEGPTPFFETCNVAYRRDAFDRAGGFDETDPLLHPETGRAFGEDALLGATVLRNGGTRAYADDALVYHRCVPRTLREHLADIRQLRLFPGLARRSPLLGRFFFARVFLNQVTASFDLAVLAVVVAVFEMHLVPLVASLPWLTHRVRTTHWHGGGLRLFVKYAVSDVVTFASLVEGSARYGRLVL
jgi:glycosyltransferase involved in cell wall biosynthesis